MAGVKILSGTGRGTMRSMVEGAGLMARPLAVTPGRESPPPPSAVPLPVPGRIW